MNDARFHFDENNTLAALDARYNLDFNNRMLVEATLGYDGSSSAGIGTYYRNLVAIQAGVDALG